MAVPLMEGGCGARRGSPPCSASVFLFVPVLAGGGIAAFRAFIDEADSSPKVPLTGDGILILDCNCGNREAYSDQSVGYLNRTCSWAHRVLAIVFHG